MIFLTENDTKTIRANKLVQLYAGSPTALKTALKKEGLSYVKIQKGATVNFTVRSIKTREVVTKIRL